VSASSLSCPTEVLVPLSLDQITEFLTENIKLLKNVQEPEECKKAINIFVDKIIVYPDYFDLVYKFPMLPSDADVNGGGGECTVKVTNNYNTKYNDNRPSHYMKKPAVLSG
jgi:hypothetical protein